MNRYAAFLRGVNLGAKRRTGSAELRAAFEGLGFGDVATFRNSGNVIFGADRAREKALAERIEAGLREAFGFGVPVILRSGKEVAAIAVHEPFEPDATAASKGKQQVMLLAAKPTAAVGREVLALATENDLLALHGRELYWLPSGGTRESALDQNAIAAALGLVTMRTKGTIEQLAAKYFAK